MLLKSRFEHVRSKGSHRIYTRGSQRFVIPFHSGKILHPKITKNLIDIIDSDS